MYVHWKCCVFNISGSVCTIYNIDVCGGMTCFIQQLKADNGKLNKNDQIHIGTH